jgi:hypothetical protein
MLFSFAGLVTGGLVAQANTAGSRISPSLMMVSVYFGISRPRNVLTNDREEL